CTRHSVTAVTTKPTRPAPVLTYSTHAGITVPVLQQEQQYGHDATTPPVGEHDDNEGAHWPGTPYRAAGRPRWKRLNSQPSDGRTSREPTPTTVGVAARTGWLAAAVA